MDRRGFLGTLASLPIVGVIVPKNKEPEVTKEMIEKVLNHPLDDPVWQTIPCSGLIPTRTIVNENSSGAYGNGA